MYLAVCILGHILYVYKVQACNSWLDQPLQLRVRNENLIFLFPTKTYVVGTQKNHLNETVVLITQNIC